MVRICQGPVPMHEGISWRASTIFSGKTAARGKSVSKLYDRTRSVLSCVRGFHSMMQVNLNFAPACVAVFREAVDQGSVVFFCRIKICVAQRLPFVVAPGVNRRGVLMAPFF